MPSRVTDLPTLIARYKVDLLSSPGPILSKTLGIDFAHGPTVNAPLGVSQIGIFSCTHSSIEGT